MFVRSLSLFLAVAVTLIVGHAAVAQCPGSHCYLDESRQVGNVADTFTGFGIMSDGTASDGEIRPDVTWEIYIDDVTYSTETGSESQSFDSEGAASGAGWVGRDNGPGKPNSGGVDPTDYGYKNSSNTLGSAGEAGGITARGSLLTGYYGDTTIGTVDMLQHDLHADGKIYLDGTTADHQFFIGWFQAKTAPDEQQERFVGFQIFEGSDPNTGNRSARVRVAAETGNGQSFPDPVSLVDVITQNQELFFTLDYSATTGVLRGTIFAIPEPTTALLGIIGMMGIMAGRRRTR